ncbi:unnamed protein product [Psylliodes chrysocephalus]|uniref:Uncharacterized protein n=1 Tax=Psylliodes chrysocephalus TaxID=3402493 RepID=A0A9P0GEB0_9CUCU|nr:unnamed protein product [Psylliodes chrysocephala]
MVKQKQLTVKRKVFKNEVSSESSGNYFDSDDSVKDQNYYPDVGSSDSLTDDDLSAEENNKNDEEVKRLKTQRHLHHRRAAAMQNSLREEVESAKTNGGKIVLTFDLQETLPTPSLTVGPAFYLRKASTYKLGVHDCVGVKATMFMWPKQQRSEVVKKSLVSC